MIKRCYFTLILTFLCALAPLQAMEKKPSKEETIQFFDAIENYFTKYRYQPYNQFNLYEIWDIQQVITLIKKNTSIINEVNSNTGNTPLDLAIQLTFDGEYESDRGPNFIHKLLQSGAHPSNKYFFDSNFLIQKDRLTRNRIAHLLLSHGAAIEESDTTSDVFWSVYVETQRVDQIKKLRTNHLDDLINIVKKHIHTRLSIAIHDNNAQEVKRLMQKYTIDVNKPLSCYRWMFSAYGKPSATLGLSSYNDISSNNLSESGIPLLSAVFKSKDAVVRMLVNELNADVTIQNSAALYCETDIKIVEFLLSKGAKVYSDTDDWIDDLLNPEMREEVGHQTERLANARAIKKAFDAVPKITVDDSTDEDTTSTDEDTSDSEQTIYNQQAQKNQSPWIPLQDVTITDEDRKNQKFSPIPKFTDRRQTPINQNSGIPLNPAPVTDKEKKDAISDEPQPSHNNFTPNNDPTNNPTNVITKSALPWKLIGGGVVIVAAVVAGKKLYNWYYAKTEENKEKAEVEETNTSAENAAATA